MEEIILTLKEWEAARTQPGLLQELFLGKIGFVLDINLFTIGTPLHAYAAIKNGNLGFYVISEENDIASTPQTLARHCHWFPCKEALTEDQQIPEEEALARIVDWKNHFPQWINQVVPSEFGMYQTFYIPTTSLQPETYSVFFALKNNAQNPGLKAADLVLKNDANLYFDTVRRQPPYRPRADYYILDLL